MFKSRLRGLRLARNLTQRQVADAVCVAQNTVSHWENGTRQPDPDSLIRLALFFDCSIDYLLGKEKQLTPQEAIQKERLRKLNTLFLQMDNAEQVLLLAVAAKMKH